MDRENRLLRYLLFGSELFAFAALASTGDILRFVMGLTIAGLVALHFLESRLPRRSYTTGILAALLVPVIVLIDKINGFRALEDAAHLVLLLHLAIFFLPSLKRARHFRLGSTFAITSLAASLSPELLTGVFIVFYFAFAFMTLLMQFVFEFSSNRFKDLARFGLFRSMASVLLGVCGFLMTTAVIFPMIPRINVNRFIKTNSLGRLGFSGEVDLQSKADPTQSSTVALRIEVPADEETKSRLSEQELLKARNLDSFDGRSWYTSPSRQYTNASLGALDGQISVVLQREAIDVSSLPIFYGSEILEILTRSHEVARLQKSTGNNYRVPGSSKSRLTYRVSLPTKNEKLLIPVEAPINSNSNPKTEIPELNRLIESYSSRIFRAEKPAPQMIADLERFFKREHFAYSLDVLNEAAESGYARLAKFLSVDKKGHCELFATAAALLLRSRGIPTRLAAGFRMPETRSNRFIVLRNSDAHVWVEVWDRAEKKWIVYDPTPAEFVPVWKQIYKEAVGFRDDIEAYWYRFVVDSEEIEVSMLVKGLLASALEHRWVWGLIVLAFALALDQWRRSHRRRLLARFGILPRPELLRLARIVERLEKQIPNSEDVSLLRGHYNELRFSKMPIEPVFREKITRAFELVKRCSHF